MTWPTSIGPGKISYEDDYGSSQGHIHINVGHRHGSSLKFPTRKGPMTIEDVREHGSPEMFLLYLETVAIETVESMVTCVFRCNSMHLEL